MKEHVKLRLKYRELMREGDKDGAQKALRDIWKFNKNKRNSNNLKSKLKALEESEEESSEDVEVVETQEPSKESVGLDDLTSIKGFGKKSLADVKRQFSSVHELITGLKENRVSLRDDIVEKLKRRLIK